jgi:hypothetical protein
VPKKQIEIQSAFQALLRSPCHATLRLIPKNNNINTSDWNQYGLYIVSAGVERLVDSREYPLDLYRKLELEGRKPRIMIMKYGRPLERYYPDISIGDLEIGTDATFGHDPDRVNPSRPSVSNYSAPESKSSTTATYSDDPSVESFRDNISENITYWSAEQFAEYIQVWDSRSMQILLLVCELLRSV